MDASEEYPNTLRCLVVYTNCAQTPNELLRILSPKLENLCVEIKPEPEENRRDFAVVVQVSREGTKPKKILQNGKNRDTPALYAVERDNVSFCTTSEKRGGGRDKDLDKDAGITGLYYLDLESRVATSDKEIVKYVSKRILEEKIHINRVVVERATVEFDVNTNSKTPPKVAVVRTSKSSVPLHSEFSRFKDYNAIYNCRPYKTVSFDLFNNIREVGGKVTSDARTVESVMTRQDPVKAFDYKDVRKFYRLTRELLYILSNYLFCLLCGAATLYSELTNSAYEWLWAFRIFGFAFFGCGSDIVLRSDSSYTFYRTYDIDGAHTRSAVRYARDNPTTCDMRSTVYEYEFRSVDDRPVITPITASLRGVFRDIWNSSFTCFGWIVEMLFLFLVSIYSTSGFVILSRTLSVFGISFFNPVLMALSEGISSVLSLYTGFAMTATIVTDYLNLTYFGTLTLWFVPHVCLVFASSHSVAFVKKTNGRWRTFGLFDLSRFIVLQTTCYLAIYFFMLKCAVKLISSLSLCLRFLRGLIRGDYAFQVVNQ